MSSKNVNNKKLYTFLRLYFGFSVRSLCVYFLQHCFPQDPRKYSNLTALINCFKRRRIFQSWEKQTLRLLYVDLCRKLNMICGNGEKEPLKATFGNFTDFHSAHFAVMKFLLMLKSIFNGKSKQFSALNHIFVWSALSNTDGIFLRNVSRHSCAWQWYGPWFMTSVQGLDKSRT